jgi:hypothetical protein
MLTDQVFTSVNYIIEYMRVFLKHTDFCCVIYVST